MAITALEKIADLLSQENEDILPSIRDRKDLFDFLCIMGLKFRKEPICVDHNSPFNFLADAFFEEENYSLVWACRGGGKSLLLALLTWLNSLYKPGCQTRVLAGSLEQGQQVYEHTLTFWDKYPDSKKLLSSGPFKSRTELKNRSTYSILTASPTSVRGPHPHRLIIDELDEIPKSIFEAALSQPQSSAGITAGIVIASTLHKSQGLMHEMVLNAELSGYKQYTWCYKEIAESCVNGRCFTANGIQCLLFGSCRGELGKQRSKFTGYYSITDLVRRYRSLTRESWENEWECYLPTTKEYLFDRKLIQYSVGSVNYRDGETIMGIDWGDKSPTVVLIIQRDGSIVEVIEEFFWSKRLLTWRCEEINRLAKKFRVTDIYADSSDLSGNSLLRSRGLNVHPFSFHFAERKTSVDLIRWYFEHHKIIISKKCVALVNELNYIKRSTEPNKIQVKKCDHGVDALEAAFKHFWNTNQLLNDENTISRIKVSSLSPLSSINSLIYLTDNSSSWKFDESERSY